MLMGDYFLLGLALLVDYLLYGWIKKLKQNNHM